MERSLAIAGMETFQLMRAPLPAIWGCFFAALCAISGAAQSISSDDIVRGADQRIERFRKGNLVLALTDQKGNRLGPGSHVRIEQVRHKFLFGANLFRFGKIDQPGQEALYRERFADLMNYATAPFYWRAYEKVQGKPDYESTDQLIEWCRSHGIEIKGHPLAWNLNDPDWLPVDPEAVQRLMLGRVTAIVRRFSASIRYWDAFNELTAYDRPSMRQDAPMETAVIDSMGQIPYAQAVLRAARQGNPQAVLIVNDYLTGPRFQDLLAKVAVDSGRPGFDVVGIQSHQHTGVWEPEKIWKICDTFAALGKPIHFTETTILSGPLQGFAGPPDSGWNTTPEGERLQAEQVVRYYTILFSNPAVAAITWWDLTDLHAWKNAPAGLLRRDMSPKPAYTALKNLIKNKWWTRAECVTDAKGDVRMRAFYGAYELTAQSGDKQLHGEFRFDSENANALEVHLH
jgi:endo-1,4-beta-xylanase